MREDLRLICGCVANGMPDDFGVSLDTDPGSSWNTPDKYAVLFAASSIAEALQRSKRPAQLAANRLARANGDPMSENRTPGEVFRGALGKVSFLRSAESTDYPEGWAETFAGPSGATVRVYTAVRQGAYTFQNATHEIGHGFDARAGLQPRAAFASMMISYVYDGQNIALGTGAYGTQAGFATVSEKPSTWQANPSADPGEELADMFWDGSTTISPTTRLAPPGTIGWLLTWRDGSDEEKVRGKVAAIP
jgi:hypothetical protein